MDKCGRSEAIKERLIKRGVMRIGGNVALRATLLK